MVSQKFKPGDIVYLDFGDNYAVVTEEDWLRYHNKTIGIDSGERPVVYVKKLSGLAKGRVGWVTENNLYLVSRKRSSHLPEFL